MVALKSLGVFALVSTIALSGCTNSDGTRSNTGTGAGVGAIVGGLLGSAFGDGEEEAIAIGAIAGGVLGGAIGADLDRQEAALRQSMGNGVGIVNTGSQLIVSLPEAITFPVNSAVVKSRMIGSLNTLAASMNDYPNTTVEIVGHTDNTGTVAYNQQLSEQRARAVRGILRAGGVKGRRLVAIGAGETRPIASNATGEGRQQNRRVEIFITPNR